MASLFNISNRKQNWFSLADHLFPNIINSLDNLPDDPRFQYKQTKSSKTNKDRWAIPEEKQF